MGSALARRLLKRGRTVKVFDVRQDAVAELTRDKADTASPTVPH
jgi:2-hydroxy-3-oxopropionate reductase